MGATIQALNNKTQIYVSFPETRDYFNKSQIPFSIEDENVLHLRAGFTGFDMFMELNNARYLKGTSVNSTFYLATPKIQNQGMGTQYAYCLSSGHNTESGFLAKPQRASKLICHDGRWMYFLQEAHRNNQICTSALMKVCVTSKQGLIPAPDVLEAFGAEDTFAGIPDWVAAWINAESQWPWPSA